MIQPRLKTFISYCSITALVFFISCSGGLEEEVMSSNPADQVPAEVILKLKKIGFDTEDIRMHPNGFLVEGDIVVTADALAEMEKEILAPGAPHTEHARSTNVVNNYQTIRVRGVNMDRTTSAGLDYALANYNNLDIGLTFLRVTSNEDITVTMAGSNPGGIAGFPYGGNPYPYVQVGGGNSQYGVNVCEHVITHELGHCIGMRHTDWFDRSFSCGTGGMEDDTGIGTVILDGVHYDAGSLFNACFSLTTNGEFCRHDDAVLDALY